MLSGKWSDEEQIQTIQNIWEACIQFSKGSKRMAPVAGSSGGNGEVSQQMVDLQKNDQYLLEQPVHAENTLRYWASVDDPKEYLQLTVEEGASHIMKSSPVGQSDWAEVLYGFFRHKYVFTSMGYYSFNGDRWVAEDSPIELFKAISDTKYLSL